jgi:hypothetical protein
VHWERWFPEHPSAEILEEKIQQGFDSFPNQPTAACEAWLSAWGEFRTLFERGGARSIKDLDTRFQGTNFNSNWCLDLEMELANAGLVDPTFHHRRITYSHKILENPLLVDDGIRGNFRRVWANSLIILGNEEESDALFDLWL